MKGLVRRISFCGFALVVLIVAEQTSVDRQMLALGGPPASPPSAVVGDSAGTYTAVSCSRAHVQAASALVDAYGPGGTLVIPAGTCHWTSGWTWNPPANTTVRGSGSLSTTGGGDVTKIIDDIAADTWIMAFNLQPTGTFRFAGLTVEGGTGDPKQLTGMLYVGGPASVRIDHMHMNTQTYSVLRVQPKIWHIGNKVFGVMDHSIIDSQAGGANYVYNGMGVDGQGNTTWTEPTDFGGPTYFFFEDNIYNAMSGALAIRMGDLFSAGKAVARFNTVNGGSGFEGHHTGHSHDDRSARSMEHYGNQYNYMPGLTGSGSAYTMADARSGTSLIWGNAMGTNAISNGIVLGPPTRADFNTYPILAEPAGYGFCNGAPKTGTASVAANGITVTKTGGDNFDTNWPQYSVFYLDGVGRYYIDSVSSTTSLTLYGAGAGKSASGTWIIGSSWDGNADIYGNPCLDQAGRGAGQLLTGTFGVGGGKLNNATGTRAWPNQALEPVYIWNNSGSIAPGTGSYYVQGYHVVAGRDFYKQASAIQSNSTTPFNGTTTDATAGAGNGGVGWGTIANRPTTCTPGVAYWATNEGNWNRSSSNPQGVQQSGADGRLYKCTATNTWTLYYTPYTYPHPLNQ